MPKKKRDPNLVQRMATMPNAEVMTPAVPAPKAPTRGAKKGKRK